MGIEDSTTTHFESLIRSGGKYIIPKFQRDYSWDQEQWDDLWQDIENMRSEKSDHYMGYLVLQTVVDSKDRLIIDGQQRFTTLVMIILAAIKSIQKIVDKGIEVDENKQRIKTLKDTYIGNLDPVSLDYDNILVLNRNNDAYYKDFIVKLGDLKIRGISHTEKLMKNCFEWYEGVLEKKFTTGREYAEFIRYIVDHLFFTVILVSNEMNAFRVFETLNARGVQLSSADLLKNYLFSLVDDASSHPERIRSLEDKWSDLTKNIKAEKLPDFIRYYWNSKNKTVRSSDLFKAIRDHIRTDVQVFELVNDMLNYSEVYMALRDSNDELWTGHRDVCDNIELLNIFKLKQPYSLLMVAYTMLNMEMFSRILNDVVIVGFRYNVICGKNPNDIERVYNNIAVKISNEKIYDKQMLKNVYVDDNEFLASFNYKSFIDNSKNTKIIKYILGKYERLKGGTRDVSLSSENDTIEHILPQHPNDSWMIEDFDFEQYIYRLGNLTLLEQSLNNDIGNESYEEKKKIYLKSAFVTTKNISSSFSQWDATSITERQRDMGRCAKSIWRIDF